MPRPTSKLAQNTAIPSSLCLGVADGELAVLRIDQEESLRKGAEALLTLEGIVRSGHKQLVAGFEVRDALVSVIEKRNARLRLLYALPFLRLAFAPRIWWLERRNRQAASRLPALQESIHQKGGSTLSFALSEEQIRAYEETAEHFKTLSASPAVWWLDAPQDPHASYDRLELESGYPRRFCQLSLGSHPSLRAQGIAFVIEADHAAFYIYPLFCLIERSGQPAQVLPIDQLRIELFDIAYLEDTALPKDVHAVSHARIKTGGRKRRDRPVYRDFPMVRYGGVRIVHAGKTVWAMMASHEKPLNDFLKSLGSFARTTVKAPEAGVAVSEFEGGRESEKAALNPLEIVLPKHPRRWAYPLPELAAIAAAGLIIWFAGNNPGGGGLMAQTRGLIEHAIAQGRDLIADGQDETPSTAAPTQKAEDEPVPLDKSTPEKEPKPEGEAISASEPAPAPLDLLDDEQQAPSSDVPLEVIVDSGDEAAPIGESEPAQEPDTDAQALDRESIVDPDSEQEETRITVTLETPEPDTNAEQEPIAGRAAEAEQVTAAQEAEEAVTDDDGTVEQIEINVDIANIRASPGLDANILRQYSRGQILTVFGREPGWFLVGGAESLGWISDSVVTAVE